jgi:hypothetical protein
MKVENKKMKNLNLLFTELAITSRLGVRALTLTLNDGCYLDSSLLLLIITHPNLCSLLFPSTLVFKKKINPLSWFMFCVIFSSSFGLFLFLFCRGL